MIIKYKQFQSFIMQAISTSGLNVGEVYFILKDILREVEALYEAQINKELQETQQQDNGPES